MLEESLLPHTRSATEPSNRSRAVPQICKGALHLIEDVEVDGALVVYSNDSFGWGVLHHHGSQLLAAVRDRRPSFTRIGSSKLPRFHR